MNHPSYILKENDSHLVIQDGVEVITKWLLDSALCYSVTKVTLGKDVKKIEKEVFEEWQLLTKVHFNDALEEVGEGAFLNCRSLKEIDFHNVKSVSEYTFVGCFSLTRIRFNNALEKVGANACQDFSFKN